MIRKLLSNVLVVSLLLTLVVNTVSFAPKVNAASLSAGDYVPGELLVKFKDGFSPDALFLAKNNLHSPKKISENLYLVKIKNSFDVSTAVQAVAANTNIKYAEPNFIYQLQSVEPQDRYFNLQWGLFNNGFLFGVPGSDIKAKQAWSTQYGTGKPLKVAIIDTGIKFDHPDLLDRVIDGENFINGSNPSNYSDSNGHGTYVAGVIGANLNDRGIAGVNSQVELFALKAFDVVPNTQLPLPIGNTADVVEAINYATPQKDIRIINISWGNYNFSQALFDAIAQKPNILFIAAAGNGIGNLCASPTPPDAQEALCPVPLPINRNNMDTNNNNDIKPYYPASFDLPNIISVTGSNHGDNLYGNYGAKSVHLAAPANDTFTTDIFPHATRQSAGCSTYGSLDTSDNMYRCVNGTSMAAAYVTGAASLYWGGNLAKSNLEVKAAILGSVDRMPAFIGTNLTGGRLNLHNLVTGNFTSVWTPSPPRLP